MNVRENKKCMVESKIQNKKTTVFAVHAKRQ